MAWLLRKKIDASWKGQNFQVRFNFARVIYSYWTSLARCYRKYSAKWVVHKLVYFLCRPRLTTHQPHQLHRPHRPYCKPRRNGLQIWCSMKTFGSNVVNTNSARRVKFSERKWSHTGVESTHRWSKAPRHSQKAALRSVPVVYTDRCVLFV